MLVPDQQTKSEEYRNSAVAIGGKADVARTPNFGSD